MTRRAPISSLSSNARGRSMSQSRPGVIIASAIVGLWGILTPLLVAQETPRLNRMIEALESGQPAISSETWTWVEQEHQPFTVQKLKRALDMVLANRNAKGQVVLAPYVRIPTEGDEPKRWIIKQVLEAGAMGIIVPRVDTPEQALDVVQAMRFPQPAGSRYFEPNGRRGCCTFPANWMLESPRDYWDGGMGDVWPLNPAGELFAAPMIESPEGVENLDAILNVPGVSAVIIGTSDLNVNFGEGWVGPQNPTFGPKTEAAIQEVFSKCTAAKKPCGIATWNEAATKKYLDMGARFIYAFYKPGSATSPASMP